MASHSGLTAAVRHARWWSGGGGAATAVLATSFLVVPALAVADPVQDKADCLNYRLEAPKREEACTRVLGGDQISAGEKAEALYRRGNALVQQKKYDPAIADFNQAIALNGGNGDYYAGRANAYRLKRDFANCIADYTKAAEIRLDKSNAYLFRGECQYLQRKYAEAIADFDLVLKQRPKDLQTLYLRGFAYSRLDKIELALADFDAYLAASPFHAATLLARGNLYAKKGDKTRAISDLRSAVLLNPNLSDDAESLKELAPVAQVNPPTAPIDFAPPAPRTRFTYLQTEAKDVPPKDEMEEAIGGLVAWFRRPTLPQATRATRFDMTIDSFDGQDAFVATKRLAAFPATNAPAEQQLVLHRGLWPRIWPAPDDMRMLIGYDAAALDRLWPLKIGHKAQGEARLGVPQCPPTPDLRSAFDCPPEKRLDMGVTKWKTELARWEQVVVPAGRFEAMVIRHQEDMELSFMGRSMKRSTLVHYWYAPAVKWWIKRTTQADGQIQTVELVAAQLP